MHIRVQSLNYVYCIFLFTYIAKSHEITFEIVSFQKLIYEW